MVGKMATVIKNISTVPFYSLQEGKVKLVKFQSDGLPCFFTRESYDQELNYARNVLKSDGWNVDNIFGREFNIYDLCEFVELGRNDENFSWERKKCQMDIIKHYYSSG